MKFLDYIDKLPPEDRQVVIDHFVQNILGQASQKEVVIRRTAKISTLGTEDEIIEEISKTFNIPIDEIKKQNIGQQLKNLTQGYHKTSALIDNYREFLIKNNAKKDKHDELYDLGKFLVALNIKSHLEIPKKISSIPDFIILSENKRIGIEHTRLINHISQIWIRTVSQILKKAESILLKRKPALNQIVNIGINYWKLNINGKGLLNKLSILEKDELASEIADFIESLITNTESVQPHFIDNVSISERSEHPLNFVLNENYIAKAESNNLFAERINEKELKLGSYLANNFLDEIWLLIVISGVTGSSSFFLQQQSKFQTKFDKVFLFDNFSHEYLVCKNN